ncbi:MAG: phytoene desaturase family protein, partial [Planctomycetota bacterium]
GGSVHLETTIEEVIVEDGCATGLRTEAGDEERFDGVVINADFGHAMQNLIPQENLRKYTPQKLSKWQLSCSTFMLYLGVDQDYPNLPHHNIIFADDYENNVDEVMEEQTVPTDPSFYVQNASVTDPTLAPNGKSTIYVLVPVPNTRSGLNWDEAKGPFAERILDLLEQEAGFPTLREHIEEQHVITPDDWQGEYNVYDGATFNLAHTMFQLLYFRPHNRFQEVDNVYLVGGGTHPGSGLPTIYESGRISADLICEDIA